MINMRTPRARTSAVVALLGAVLAGCGSGGSSAASTAASTIAVAAPSIETAPSAPQPTEPSTTRAVVTSLPPTTTVAPTTTLTPGPPVFDPQTIGSNLDLPSFVVTVTVANTNNGQLSTNVTTSGFIDDPRSTYELATYSYDGTTDGASSYLVDGRSYEQNPSGDWSLHEAGSRGVPDNTKRLDLRSGIVSGVLTADFDAEADVEGVPANHFVFDETDLANYTSYTAENPSPVVEGDLYLAKDGGYVLFAHSKETSPGRTYEVTETLSSIGALGEIVLPAEFAPMTQALDVGVELAALLPTGTSLSAMTRYEHGIGIDYYTYTTPLRNNDDVLNFFRTLAPTNGWTVTHIGHVDTHLEPINCETDIDCTILNNGGEQIVVSFRNGITLEYDHQHVFSPL